MEEIASLQAQLHSALDQVLDLDAGLADARLPDLHQALTQILDTTLDLDTGRAQILPPTPTAAPTGTLPGLRGLAHDLNSRSVSERLLARTQFPFQEMLYLRSIAELTDKAMHSIPVPASEIERARNHARAVSQTGIPSAVLHFRTLTKAMVELERGTGNYGRMLSALDHATMLTTYLVRNGEIRNALHDERWSSPSPQAMVTAIDEMIDAVTSVAGADLRDMDLSGVPLEGLRWSESTRWPEDWKFYVVENSVEVRPGLWEIRFGDVDATV